MMTREQREAAYAAIRILRMNGSTPHADAISQALADLHEYETTVPRPVLLELKDEAHEVIADGWTVEGVNKLLVGGDGQVVMPDPEPETYRYLVAYRYGGRVETIATREIERSTPILTSQDIDSVSRMLNGLEDVIGTQVLAFSLLRG